MIKFNVTYFSFTIALFVIELLIAFYMHDTIIRPYGGDFLVVIFMYCFVKSFINAPCFLTAAWVLMFAYAVEVSQYFHLVNALGLQHSKTAKILLGTSFSFFDLGMYTLGMLVVLFVENAGISLKKF
jgi:hypothetical protein